MAIRVTKAEFEEKVLKNSLPVLVDFYSDSCVACKKLSPVLGDLEDEYEDRLQVVKVNTNFDGEIAAKYEVNANPTLLLFRNEEILLRHVGAITYDDLADQIDEVL